MITWFSSYVVFVTHNAPLLWFFFVLGCRNQSWKMTTFQAIKLCTRVRRYTYILQRTFELKIQITKHSRRPQITQKYCFQCPRSRSKSVFHDIYVCLKGTELSFLWRIYTSRGSSDWIVVGAYYGRIIITPGLKGLMVMVYVKYLWQNSIVWKHNYHNG